MEYRILAQRAFDDFFLHFFLPGVRQPAGNGLGHRIANKVIQ